MLTMLPILAQDAVLRLSEPLLQYKMRTFLFASVCVDQDLKIGTFSIKRKNELKEE